MVSHNFGLSEGVFARDNFSAYLVLTYEKQSHTNTPYSKSQRIEIHHTTRGGLPVLVLALREKADFISKVLELVWDCIPRRQEMVDSCATPFLAILHVQILSSEYFGFAITKINNWCYVLSDVAMFIIRSVWQGLLEQKETGCVCFVIKLVFRVFHREKVEQRLGN